MTTLQKIGLFCIIFTISAVIFLTAISAKNATIKMQLKNPGFVFHHPDECNVLSEERFNFHFISDSYAENLQIKSYEDKHPKDKICKITRIAGESTIHLYTNVRKLDGEFFR